MARTCSADPEAITTAAVDDVGASADAEGFTHIMVGDQHPDAARGQFANDALDVEHRQRVDARKRLIEQDEARLGGQRARNLDPAALARRTATCRAVLRT